MVNNNNNLNNSFVLSLFYIWYRASETNKLLWLLSFHSGYRGDQVTIAARSVAHAYCFTKPGYQIYTQYDLKQRPYKCFNLVAMGTELPWQWGMRLMSIVPRNVHTKYELNSV